MHIKQLTKCSIWYIIAIFNISSLASEFEFKKYCNKIFHWEFWKFVEKLNKIEWNWFRFVIYFCLLLWSSVNNCRVLYNIVNSWYFWKNIVDYWRVSVHFCSKFVQNGCVSGIKRENCIFRTQNASWHHFVHYSSSKQTKISVIIHLSLKLYSTVKNK